MPAVDFPVALAAQHDQIHFVKRQSWMGAAGEDVVDYQIIFLATDFALADDLP